MTGKGGDHWHLFHRDQSGMPVIALYAITISTIEWRQKPAATLSPISLDNVINLLFLNEFKIIKENYRYSAF